MLWLIDLDDTLFQASDTMFEAIHHEMNRFLVRELHLTPDEAQHRRLEYWAKYGATYEGVWRHHGIDPIRFLRETHAFDLTTHVKSSPNTSALWRTLPGNKVVYTNGPRHYAQTLLAHLGLDKTFDGLVTSTESYIAGRWHAKPAKLPIHAILQHYRTPAHKACLVDDSLKNLKCAAQCGLKTVWMTGFKKLAPLGSPAYVTARVESLWALRRLRLA